MYAPGLAVDLGLILVLALGVLDNERYSVRVEGRFHRDTLRVIRLLSSTPQADAREWESWIGRLRFRRGRGVIGSRQRPAQPQERGFCLAAATAGSVPREIRYASLLQRMLDVQSDREEKPRSWSGRAQRTGAVPRPCGGEPARGPVPRWTLWRSKGHSTSTLRYTVRPQHRPALQARKGRSRPALCLATGKTHALGLQRTRGTRKRGPAPVPRLDSSPAAHRRRYGSVPVPGPA